MPETTGPLAEFEAELAKLKDQCKSDQAATPGAFAARCLTAVRNAAAAVHGMGQWSMDPLAQQIRSKVALLNTFATMGDEDHSVQILGELEGLLKESLAKDLMQPARPEDKGPVTTGEAKNLTRINFGGSPSYNAAYMSTRSPASSLPAYEKRKLLAKLLPSQRAAFVKGDAKYQNMVLETLHANSGG